MKKKRRFYKGIFGPFHEYYYAGSNDEPYWYYDAYESKWVWTQSETWLRRQFSTHIEKVSPLEVIVVIGSFPEEYDEVL